MSQTASGVYLLFLAGQLTYVGRSDDCPARIRAHRQNGRRFDHFRVLACTADDSVWIERALVSALAPPENIRMVPGNAVRSTPSNAVPEAPQPRRLLRLPETIARTGRSRSRIYDDVAKGHFPKPVKIGGRAMAFVEAEIDQWIVDQIQRRDDAA